MTINKQLTILMLLITLFSTIVGISTLKVSEVSRFHQLNSLHFNYVLELNELINKSKNGIPDTTVLKEVVNNIKAQPTTCVAIPGRLDLLLMELTNTQSIVTICQNDIDVADELLKNIVLFEERIINHNTIKKQLNDSYTQFRINSVEFIKPVDKLTSFITKSSQTAVITLSIAFFLIAFAIAKAILKIVKRMQKTSNELMVSEERNRLQANRDALTKLPNRNALDLKINQYIALAGQKRLAVFFIDLDRFKDINDTRGHAQGDKLLITISDRLSEAMQVHDSVFRFGGDEFVALSHFTNAEDIKRVAESLVKAISKPVFLGNTELYVTGSVGISIYPTNANTAENLIKYADTAMYEAKKEGKNQYLFYKNSFSQKHTRRLSHESKLRYALDKGQLQVMYQPVVDLNTFATEGTEALLRWQLDQETVISPDVFVPIAEYSGQMVEIGEWVLRIACKQNKIWRDSGAKNVNMAVNVSPYQLFDPNFSQLVQNVITEFEIPYHCLDLEITESMIITENEHFLKTLNELSEMGVRLLMDDFGTGYSCLSNLRNLPFDILKIDKSFVTNYDTIASTIIAMGKQLDMKIVAEGVETSKSLEILRRQQCDFAQGYLFQAPSIARDIDIFKTYTQ
ncbi:putative bifunctional diguanylate cyclase/phosphodiesterase [Psychromonas sp. 14N.309.X.WAT.B.A12]|uniref:putative bifunctional diguanylate cyclase/phosphodiesterase n=1 Tax=unclassified Psychromonas TaxID=2614957 RepID=UPI0025B24BBB|nr:EAL domain-containing protein [Psychromonas sp. 14N.309.X.WAT.B.A12]MDN2664798.1 EAL domain-containing protein [Psychromonas sp. 14N.309.X.WAT.B.A12]